MKKTLMLLPLVFLALFALACSDSNSLQEKGGNNFSKMLSDEGFRARLLSGQLAADELSSFVKNYDSNGCQIKPDEPTDGNFIIPETGTLRIALKYKKSPYVNEIVMKSGTTTLPIFTIGNGQTTGSINTEIGFHEGTKFILELKSQKPDGSWYTVSSDSQHCRAIYHPAEKRWDVYFADTIGASHGSTDDAFKDVVLSVHVLPIPYIDLSRLIDVKVDYLNYHGLNKQGYPIYYIGETMNYVVNIKAKTCFPFDFPFGEKRYTVYVLHEYFENETCNRTWYQPPLRPANEPQLITVHKGDPLPNQVPLATWHWQPLSHTESTVLNGSYTSTRAVAAGNDQTRVIIVSENDCGMVELKIYDNPQAGVFDPPSGEE